jgi:hypothetical protein
LGPEPRAKRLAYINRTSGMTYSLL